MEKIQLKKLKNKMAKKCIKMFCFYQKGIHKPVHKIYVHEKTGNKTETQSPGLKVATI